MHQAESPTEPGAQLDARKRREHKVPRQALAAVCLTRAWVFLLAAIGRFYERADDRVSVTQVQFAGQAEGRLDQHRGGE